MIGLTLSFVSKHNMWSYYDWFVVVVVVSKHMINTTGATSGAGTAHSSGAPKFTLGF